MISIPNETTIDIVALLISPSGSSGGWLFINKGNNRAPAIMVIHCIILI